MHPREAGLVDGASPVQPAAGVERSLQSSTRYSGKPTTRGLGNPDEGKDTKFPQMTNFRNPMTRGIMSIVCQLMEFHVYKQPTFNCRLCCPAPKPSYPMTRARVSVSRGTCLLGISDRLSEDGLTDCDKVVRAL